MRIWRGNTPGPFRGRRSFGGNLPVAATEESLREFFEESGHAIEEVRIMTDRDSGRSRGFAFVVLAESEDVQKVIDATNGKSFICLLGLKSKAHVQRTGLGPSDS